MIHPLCGRVKLRILEGGERESGGVVVRRSSDDCERGEVVSFGDDDVGGLAVGSEVLIPVGRGVTIEDGGEKFRFVRDEDVLAVVE